MLHIVLLGTCDTKLQELLYLRSQILDNPQQQQCKVTLVDCGRSPVRSEHITVTQDTLTIKYAPSKSADIAGLARGEVIKYMIACASNWLRKAYDDTHDPVHGVVSAGGTGGTSLASTVMKNVLPIGFPKMILSTAASGDTGPIVGETDIALLYSVVDVAGLNTLLRRGLANTAGAIVGMAGSYVRSLKEEQDRSTDQPNSKKFRVGLTMFGVTTPCVDTIRAHLEQHYPIECFVFHCTGHGGLAMERLVAEGSLDAVLDITTTEICDFLTGGVMSAGPHRMESPLKASIPYVVSVGATDMTNFGPRATVPEKFVKDGRKLYEHNPTVTLMRTNGEEAKSVGEFIVRKIDEFASEKGMVEVVLPLGGISMIATPGGPFADQKADSAMFNAIREGLRDSGVPVYEDERAINDEGFAVDVADRLAAKLGLRR